MRARIGAWARTGEKAESSTRTVRHFEIGTVWGEGDRERNR